MLLPPLLSRRLTPTGDHTEKWGQYKRTYLPAKPTGPAPKFRLRDGLKLSARGSRTETSECPGDTRCILVLPYAHCQLSPNGFLVHLVNCLKILQTVVHVVLESCEPFVGSSSRVAFIRLRKFKILFNSFERMKPWHHKLAPPPVK